MMVTMMMWKKKRGGVGSKKARAMMMMMVMMVMTRKWTTCKQDPRDLSFKVSSLKGKIQRMTSRREKRLMAKFVSKVCFCCAMLG